MDVVDEKADGVFLCCGMNDILLDEPMSSIQENISGTLDKARDAKLPIVILGIPPLTRIESTEKGGSCPANSKSTMPHSGNTASGSRKRRTAGTCRCWTMKSPQ